MENEIESWMLEIDNFRELPCLLGHSTRLPAEQNSLTRKFLLVRVCMF
jgi:hypothetical protein